MAGPDDPAHIVLSAEDFDALVAALENPAPPTPALVALMRGARAGARVVVHGHHPGVVYHDPGYVGIDGVSRVWVRLDVGLEWAVDRRACAVVAPQHCDQTCAHCAREFWRWLRAREAQMRTPRRGERTTFADAAATSVRAR
jgi:hypothetical protein